MSSAIGVAGWGVRSLMGLPVRLSPAEKSSMSGYKARRLSTTVASSGMLSMLACMSLMEATYSLVSLGWQLNNPKTIVTTRMAAMGFLIA